MTAAILPATFCPRTVLERKAPVAFRRDYDDGEVAYTFQVTESDEAFVVVSGKGNMPGAHKMVADLNDAVETLGERTVKIWFDVSQNKGAPMRSQFLFAKWFFANRKVVGKGAVVGAGPIERRMASFVCSFAGFKNIKFFEHAADAQRWLYAED